MTKWFFWNIIWSFFSSSCSWKKDIQKHLFYPYHKLQVSLDPSRTCPFGYPYSSSSYELVNKLCFVGLTKFLNKSSSHFWVNNFSVNQTQCHLLLRDIYPSKKVVGHVRNNSNKNIKMKAGFVSCKFCLFMLLFVVVTICQILLEFVLVPLKFHLPPNQLVRFFFP